MIWNRYISLWATSRCKCIKSCSASETCAADDVDILASSEGLSAVNRKVLVSMTAEKLQSTNPSQAHRRQQVQVRATRDNQKDSWTSDDIADRNVMTIRNTKRSNEKKKSIRAVSSGNKMSINSEHNIDTGTTIVYFS